MVIRLKTGFAAILAMILPAVGQAALPEKPDMALSVAERIEPHGSYDLPLGPWRDGRIETRHVEGTVTQSIWRLPATGMTTLQILALLRDQLDALGYETVFECADVACGGFDFRFGIRVAPEPEMHVDLGDFRFLSAEAGAGDAAEALSLVISRSARDGFVQVIHVSPGSHEQAGLPPAPPSPEPGIMANETPDGVAAAFEAAGLVVLEDLSFATGSSVLDGDDFGSLRALAEYLHANPEHEIILVGHTDAEGALDGNIALSKQRAVAVMERLVARHGVPPAQLRAEGMGYLSPRASNLTDEGRAMNRRVEAILTLSE